MTAIGRRLSALILCLAPILMGCTPVTPVSKTPLVVFAAGSLIVPFGQLEQAFEEAHRDVDVQLEYHGSIQVIRYVTEIKQEIDVVASADQALMPMLMYGTVDPDTGQPYADWTIRFAGNRLALAYTDRSAYHDEITADNWYEVITREDVRLGFSDPRFDPSGYRALMALKLAENVYGVRGIFDSVLRGQFETAITWFWDEGETLISVPELLATKADSRVVLRGSSIHLASLVESGDVDYAFLYESVIRQQGFHMVELPAGVNLGEEASASDYAKVHVHLDFQRFTSVRPEFTAEPIAYGITIPSNAPHPEAAARFVAFLLGDGGRAIMAANYHPLQDPIRVDDYEALPAVLQAVIVPAS